MPLRGSKGTLWEGGIRVPCIARWPEKIAPGSISPQPGITMDWAATFLAMAQITPSQIRCEGIDLQPILEGRETTVDRTLFWRRKSGPRKKNVPIERAVRKGEWKYLEQPESNLRALFHLPSDIGESRNLISEHPDKATELQGLFENWERDVETKP
ncbi:MAG: sulfatase/phosphatase domain-containing protein [Verrucomicrobiota bacterium]